MDGRRWQRAKSGCSQSASVRLGALTQPAFRALFVAQAISALGDRLVPVALAFAVLDLTGSVTDLGIVLAAQVGPLVVLGLLGGVWADRRPRQLVMLASDIVRALAQGASALLVLAGEAQVWQLVVLQALYGAGEAFFWPAATALVPQTVDPQNLQQANALLGLTGNVASVLGPAVAGVVVAALGPGWGLTMDAATFIVSAAFLSLIRPSAGSTIVGGNTLAELRTGWRSFSSRTWLWVTVAYFTLFIALVHSPLQVLGPEIARRSLGGPGGWALISTALGLGAVMGGILGLRWRPNHPLRAAFLGFLAAGPAFFALLALPAPLMLILPAAVIDGASVTLFNVFWLTALQREVPAPELSRVSSWDYVGSLALQPVGFAASGPVAAAIGLSTAMYAAGGLFLLLTLAALAVPPVRNFTAAAPPCKLAPARPGRPTRPPQPKSRARITSSPPPPPRASRSQ